MTASFQKIGLGLLVLLLTVYSLVHFVHGAFGYQGYGDFFLTLEWSRLWFNKGELVHEFGAYTPLYLLLMYPFKEMADNQVATVMHVLNLSCMAILIRLAYFRYAVDLPKETRRIWLFISLVLVLNYRPLLLGLSMIKIEFVELALIAIAFHSFRKGNDFITGACLALGASIKFVPGFFLVYFLLKRQWKVVFYGAITGLALLALTVSVFGLAYHIEYVETLKGGFLPWVDNQSLEAALLRLFVPLPPSSPFPTVTVAPIVLKLLSLVKLLIVCGIAWVIRKPIESRTSWKIDWEAGLWIAAVPLLLRFFRDYYSIFFIPIFFLAVRETLLKREKLKFAAPFLIAYLLMGQFFPIGFMTRLPRIYPSFGGNFDLFLFFSIPFYGFVFFCYF